MILVPELCIESASKANAAHFQCVRALCCLGELGMTLIL